MQNNILFACTALHKELTEKALTFIDGDVVCFWDSPPLQLIYTSLFNINKKYDWLVRFDEDVFIFDLPRVYKLIEYMQSENFDVAGVADGGVIKMRQSNPIALSPSFNIFNIKKIRDIDLDKFDANPSCEDLKQYTPTALLKYPYEYGNSEMYYPAYFGLLRAGCKFLHLDGDTCPIDEISTYVFDYENIPFLIHTWFARTYNPELKGIKPYPIEPPKLAVSLEYNTYRINDIFERHKTLELAKQEYNEIKINSI